MSGQILNKIVSLVERYAPRRPETRSCAATQLIDGGLDFDSVALLELVVELEVEFGCTISSADLTADRFRTIADVVSLMSSKLESAA